MAQWIFDPIHSSVEFSVKHLGVAWVKGRFTNLSGKIIIDSEKPEEGFAEAEIEAKSIWTGDAARDNHLRSKDFFDVERHPAITFKSTKVEKVRDSEYKVTGNITMRGITRPVVLEVSYLGAGEAPSGEGKAPTMRAGFSAKTTINRHDFGISWDAPAGSGATTVGGDVDITINVEAAKE